MPILSSHSPGFAPMQPATVRRRLPRHERRAEILSAATRVFYAKGYEAASLQDIADRMGIKKATLFYYFDSKEELLNAVLVDIIGKGMANARRVLGMPGDSLTRLWRMVAGHISHLCDNLEETAVFLHERKAIPLARRRELLTDDYSYRQAYVDLIRDGQAEGLIRGDIDVKLAALRIMGSLNWVYAWYKPDSDITPQLIGAHFAAMTINSLASEKASGWRPPADVEALVDTKTASRRGKAPKTSR